MNGIPRHYDAIVIGVGGMGSATCYNLAKRGKRVLGLERFDIPHEMGSSHGYTRIIRLAYYEHPSYVMLLHRAYQLWEDLERISGEHLLHITGSIDAGPAESWVFKGSFQSCVEHELPHEVLTGKELTQRFPGYRLPFDHMALYQPKGGFLTPERCIVAYVEAAHALGAEIHGRETVLGWEPVGDGVRVTTDRSIYEAERLVITAGAWNDNMVPQLRHLAVPERQVLAWFQPRKPDRFRPDNFPVFNLLVDEGRYYGFPVHGVPGFKIGKYHHFEEQGPADVLDRAEHEADELMLRAFTDRYFPDASGPTMTLASCMFTNTPDGHFIIDLHPDAPQVSFAAGFTGHGYKFASVIGEIMGDLAIQGYTRHDIDLFRLDRFERGGRLRQDASIYLHRPHDPRRLRRIEEIFHPEDPERRFRLRYETGQALGLDETIRWPGVRGRRRGGVQARRRRGDEAMRRRAAATRNSQFAGALRARSFYHEEPGEFLRDTDETRPFW